MSSKKLIDQKVYQDLDEFATTLETIAKLEQVLDVSLMEVPKHQSELEIEV